MLPRFAPTWRKDAARKSIVFTVTRANAYTPAQLRKISQLRF